MAYSPSTGTWLSRDPSGYIDGMDAYRMERDDPIRYDDPSGMDPTTRPTTSPVYLNPEKPGAGVLGQSAPNPWTNCFGFAWGQDVAITFPSDLKFVPTGCKEVQYDKSLDKYDCSKKNEVVVILSYSVYVGKGDAIWKNGQITAAHMIYRDKDTGDGYVAKLGVLVESEEVQGGGMHATQITDIDAHFSWYYSAPSMKDWPEKTRRCFVCERSKMRVAPPKGGSGLPTVD